MCWLLIPAFLIFVSSTAFSGDLAIVGVWQSNASTSERLGSIVVSDESISIGSCKNSPYSIVSNATTTTHDGNTRKVRAVMLKLTGVGCSPDFDYIEFRIPLEQGAGGDVAISLYPFWRNSILHFRALRNFHRESVTPNTSLEGTRGR